MRCNGKWMPWRARHIGLALPLAVAVAACDTEVTNPGPVQDAFLDDPGAWNSLYHGALRNNAFAYTRLAEAGAYQALEAHPAGVGDLSETIAGRLTSDNVNGDWTNMHRGRWLSEDAVRRLREILGGDFSSNEFARRLLIQAGVANRMLGDHVCHAVIDGGPAEHYALHYERAEAAFGEALQMARATGDRDVELSALAGRATVRIMRGDWAGAVADAREVPDDHRLLIHLYDFNRQDQDANAIFWSQARLPWSRLTVWNTGVDEYFAETGDPRVEWETDPDYPQTMTRGLPFYIATKHDDYTSPHAFASGREMRLIEAEAALRQGNWEEALEGINQIRASVVSVHTGQPIPPAHASSLEEAWTALKRERQIELWLDARRFPDLRRWTEEGTPGEMYDMTGRSLCFPIGRTEINTNPNPLPEVNQ